MNNELINNVLSIIVLVILLVDLYLILQNRKRIKKNDEKFKLLKELIDKLKESDIK